MPVALPGLDIDNTWLLLSLPPHHYNTLQHAMFSQLGSVGRRSQRTVVLNPCQHSTHSLAVSTVPSSWTCWHSESALHSRKLIY